MHVLIFVDAVPSSDIHKAAVSKVLSDIMEFLGYLPFLESRKQNQENYANEENNVLFPSACQLS